MPTRQSPRGFAVAEFVLVLAMLVMLITLVVTIAMAATRNLGRSPTGPDTPSPIASPMDGPFSD
jgi:hypothetical protein